MSTTTPGLDVSHHQGDIDWMKVASAGYRYAYAKATEDVDFVDKQFAANRINAKRAGLIFGAYHFGRGGDVNAEAAHFAAVVGTLQPGEFAVLDAEVPATTPAWCRAFLDKVTTFWNTRPLNYTYDQFRLHADWSPVSNGNYGLILAKYDGTRDAIACAPWPVLAMRQYASDGKVPGIAGDVDLDVFFGDVPTLQKYCRPGTPAPSPTPAPKPKPVPPSPQPGHFDVRAWRVNYGQKDSHLPSLQAWLNRMYPAYSHIGPLSTNYGPQTAAVIKEFAARVGIRGADGLNIGPQIAAALYKAGFRG